MNISFKKKIIIDVLIILLVTLGIAGTVIYPAITYIQNMNRQTAELRAYLEKRYLATQQLRQSRLKAPLIKQEVSAFPDYIFHSGDQLKLITALEEIASKNFVIQKIDNLNADAKTKKLKISLSIEAGYRDALRYLRDLENINYFLNLDKIIFSPTLNRFGSQTTSSTKMQIEASLYVNG